MKSWVNRNRERGRKELKEKKKIEADLEPERLLREEMHTVQRKVASNDLVIERIRGYVLLEGKEQEQDYELICNFNELSIKPLKNEHNRLKPEELGILVYGKNLNEGLVKEVMKTCRTQIKSTKTLRNRMNIT